MANIFEVAERAGVSIATVSRVLSRPETVTPGTRKKVLQAVESLGYTTNSAGKQLRTQRSGKLLVMVPDIANPFYSEVLQSIEEMAHRQGYAVLLGDTQHVPKREDRYTLMLRRREAEGLIVLGHGLPNAAVTAYHEMSANALKTSTSVPIVSGCEFDRGAGIPNVHIDNQVAARDAMDHLYALGHRRIGIITGPTESGLGRDRVLGATVRAREAGAERDLVVMKGDFTIESGAAAAERLLGRRDRSTAIFCFNDLMAIGAMNVARQRGLRIPGDLSVVGFDDILFARYTVPPLTTIAQPVREMGQETVRLLLGIIKGQLAPLSVILPHRLVVRESTAPPSKEK